MSERERSELFLKGRIQVETAYAALRFAGLNPKTQEQLSLTLRVHDQHGDGDSQTDLTIYLEGQSAEDSKTDIIAGLDAICEDSDMPRERHLAAAALRAILLEG